MDLAQTPLTEAEIGALVPPKSTAQTGSNCAILALYGAKLVSSDLAKYYSDTLAQAFEKLNSDQKALMLIDDEQIPELDYAEQTYAPAPVVQYAMAHVYANIDNSAGGGFFDGHTLIPQSEKIPGRRSAVQAFRFIAERLRPGHGVPIQFRKPLVGLSGSGAHMVVLWKHPNGKLLAILDFQRGSAVAGAEMNALYASWVDAKTPLGLAIIQRPNVLIIKVDDYTASGVLETVFMEYTIKQGLAWGFYEDEVALRSAGGPAIFVCGMYRRTPDTPVTIHLSSHRNGDTYTPEFQQALANQVPLMDTSDDVRNWFLSELAKAPIRFVWRKTLVPVSIGGTAYLRDTVVPSALHQVLQALPDNTILALRETIPDPTKRGGRRRKKTYRKKKRRATRRKLTFVY